MADSATIFGLPLGEVERILSGSTAGEVVLLVEQCLRAGAVDQALEICDLAGRFGFSDRAVSLVEAKCRAARGDFVGATMLVDGLLERAPRDPLALQLKAHLLAEFGDRDGARAAFLRVIETFPDFPGVHGSLAALAMPGAAYKEVLARTHALLRPRRYLEIGVERGSTLALATTATIAAGVDPADLPLERPLPAGARIYRTTSDLFFAGETLKSVFGGLAADMIFIDGMHRFENALRDFDHAERWASRSSTIVLHDCLAVSPISARRERATNFWVGDVWKALDALLEYRKDLRIRVVPTRPSGLVFVRGLDPTSTVLKAKLPEILARYSSEAEPCDPADWMRKYPMVENTEAGLGEALGR